MSNGTINFLLKKYLNCREKLCGKLQPSPRVYVERPDRLDELVVAPRGEGLPVGRRPQVVHPSAPPGEPGGAVGHGEGQVPDAPGEPGAPGHLGPVQPEEVGHLPEAVPAEGHPAHVEGPVRVQVAEGGAVRRDLQFPK